MRYFLSIRVFLKSALLRQKFFASVGTLHLFSLKTNFAVFFLHLRNQTNFGGILSTYLTFPLTFQILTLSLTLQILNLSLTLKILTLSLTLQILTLSFNLTNLDFVLNLINLDFVLNLTNLDCRFFHPPLILSQI